MLPVLPMLPVLLVLPVLPVLPVLALRCRPGPPTAPTPTIVRPAPPTTHAMTVTTTVPPVSTATTTVPPAPPVPPPLPRVLVSMAVGGSISGSILPDPPATRQGAQQMLLPLLPPVAHHCRIPRHRTRAPRESGQRLPCLVGISPSPVVGGRLRPPLRIIPLLPPLLLLHVLLHPLLPLRRISHAFGVHLPVQFLADARLGKVQKLLLQQGRVETHTLRDRRRRG